MEPTWINGGCLGLDLLTVGDLTLRPASQTLGHY